jgi:hypothetical protein
LPYTLIVKERNHSWAGRRPIRSVHSTKEEAETALVEYVTRNWDAEVGSERPSDPLEMVEEYFSEVPEAYEIVEAGT